MIENTWKRTFYTIWSGQAASLLTSAIVQYTLIWSLTAQTESALVLSIAGIVAFLPTALFSPFIGSYVDKHNRKKIMILADFAIALSTLILVIVSLLQTLPIWMIYACLFVRSLGSAFHEPCLQAVTPLIVPQDQLAKCGGYTGTLQSASLILSPAISAALFATMPLWFILLLDIVGAVIGITTIVISKIPRLVEEEKKELNVIEDTKEGLKILQNEKGLYYFVLIIFLFYITYIPLSTLYPLMSVSYFSKTIGDAGIVETMFSVGMLVGGLILGLWGGTKDKMKTILMGIFLLGVGTALQGMLPQNAFIMFIVLATFTGFSVPFISSLFMTLIQEKIAAQYLGRVIGVSQSIMAFAAPIGLVLSGIFAEQIGVHNWFVISGFMAIVCMILCLVVKSVRNLDRI